LVSVVDDDQSARESTEALLRSAGYKVVTFQSGEQFLESASRQETACLILDIRMPGMDGLELQRRLNAPDAGVPIIFVTAQENERNRQAAFAAGASGFFQKPFAASDFLAAVQIALSKILVLSNQRESAVNGVE
jgi:FixJ family two-component response regulator